MASLSLFLLYFNFFASAQFINPPAGNGVVEQMLVGVTLVYHVGDTLDVQWNGTNGAIVDLVIKQAGTPPAQIDRTPNSDNLARGNYKWRITIDGSDGGSVFDLLLGNAFRFNLYETGQLGQSFSSVYFNISNSTADQYGRVIARSSSSSVVLQTTVPSSSTTASTTTTSSAASVIPVAATSSKLAPTATPEPAKPGLGTGAQIGLGVGLGILGLGVIAGLAMWFLFLRKKRTAEMNRTPESVYVEQSKSPVQQTWSPPAELYAPR